MTTQVLVFGASGYVGTNLVPCLAARGETGEILRASAVAVTEVRAGVIIGPGSAAFEVIRDLVFHLPAMVTPRWVRSRSQPIALNDVLEYLTRLPEIPQAAVAIDDVGGPEVLTQQELMLQFGELVGRRPVIVPVPVLTPALSSYWLNPVTAAPTNITRALFAGLEHDVLADDAAIRALIQIPLKIYREAAQAALEIELRPEVDARTRIVATGYFHPAGAPGLIYWYALAPIQTMIFSGLAKAIAERGERDVAAGENVTPPRHARGNAGDFSR